MTDKRIEELRALCSEYERMKSEAETKGLTHEAVAGIADVGIKAMEALPELLDYIQGIEDAKRKIAQELLEQCRKYQMRYSNEHELNNYYKRIAEASVLRIGGMGCFTGGMNND